MASGSCCACRELAAACTLARTDSAASPAPRKPDLGVGDLVRHTAFGEGVVMACEPEAGDVQVTVEFSGGVGPKRLLLSFAPLEKIEE